MYRSFPASRSRVHISLRRNASRGPPSSCSCARTSPPARRSHAYDVLLDQHLAGRGEWLQRPLVEASDVLVVDRMAGEDEAGGKFADLEGDSLLVGVGCVVRKDVMLGVAAE